MQCFCTDETIVATCVGAEGLPTVRSGNVRLVDWLTKYPSGGGRVYQSRPCADSRDRRLETRESESDKTGQRVMCIRGIHSGHVCFSRQSCARNRYSWPSFVLFYLVLVVALLLGAAPLTCFLHLSHQQAVLLAHVSSSRRNTGHYANVSVYCLGFTPLSRGNLEDHRGAKGLLSCSFKRNSTSCTDVLCCVFKGACLTLIARQT